MAAFASSSVKGFVSPAGVRETAASFASFDAAGAGRASSVTLFHASSAGSAAFAFGAPWVIAPHAVTSLMPYLL